MSKILQPTEKVNHIKENLVMLVLVFIDFQLEAKSIKNFWILDSFR